MTKSVLLRLEDRLDWLAAWEVCGREPFAHPDYVEVMLSTGETAHCFLYKTPGQTVIMPIIVREIPGRPTKVMDRDAVSPYGYGGPFASVQDAHDMHFWAALREHLAKEGLITFFGRLSIGAQPSDYQASDVAVANRNVVVSLQATSEERWTQYEHKVRKNVKKARRAGLEVRISETHSDLNEFMNLYVATMKRRAADARYYFDRATFQAFSLLPSGSHYVAEVRSQGGELVSAEVILSSDKTFYSFLGGTHAEWFEHRPNDLLKHEAMDFGRSIGRDSYVLGGGYSSDDGIFRYKRSFCPDGVTDFHVARFVLDPKRYAELAQARVPTPVNEEGRTNFFPAYRR